MKYEFILDHPEHPVRRWAAVLQINKSGYYAWRKSLKARTEREANIRKRIREEFEKSRRTYGGIHARNGIEVGTWPTPCEESDR